MMAPWLLPPAGERSQHVDRRRRGHRQLAVAFTKILEVGLVDDFRAEDLGVADLHSVFRGFRVVGLGREVELPDSIVVLSVAEILVARGQRVVLADLVVETRTEVGAGPRVGHGIGKGNVLLLSLGSRMTALTAARSLIFRRSKLKKKEAFLPSGPPMFPLYCVES